VPFHVQIRRSMHHARVFNLDAGELRGRVLEPWARGGPVALGDQEWDPRDCALTVLEGAAVDPPDLAHGQGWHRALRSARDVTEDVLRASAPAAAVAVLATTPAARRVARAALDRLGVEAFDWAALRSRLLAGEHADEPIAGALIILDGHAPANTWLLDVGLAVGALGARAVVACTPDGPAADELRELGLPALEVRGDHGVAARALARRVHVALSGAEI
jgi:hypothetical protein